jgi:D5 N terminal like
VIAHTGLADELADRMIGALPVTEALSLSVAVRLSKDDGEPMPSGDRDHYLKWLTAQQSTSKRSALLATARANPRLRADRAAFGADPRWLNTPAGEIDLGAGRANDDGTDKALSDAINRELGWAPQPIPASTGLAGPRVFRRS